MKFFIFLTVCMAFLIPLSGCLFNTQIDWADFIKLNDISYLNTQQSLPEDRYNLTFYDRVIHNVQNVRDAGYDTQNGDAAFLEKGTPLYAMDGYDPGFRLAVKNGGRILIYEVDWNYNAEKGTDVLDINGKVEWIQITSVSDGITELARIDSPSVVERLVWMVVEAPVVKISKPGQEQYFVVFNLKDGTTTKRAYWIDSGEMSRLIQLPKEFNEIMRTALQKEN